MPGGQFKTRHRCMSKTLGSSEPPKGQRNLPPLCLELRPRCGIQGKVQSSYCTQEFQPRARRPQTADAYTERKPCTYGLSDRFRVGHSQLKAI